MTQEQLDIEAMSIAQELHSELMRIASAFDPLDEAICIGAFSVPATLCPKSLWPHMRVYSATRR